MSLGSLTLLNGVGGWNEIKIIEGDEDGQVFIIQDNKVMTLKISEACILQTWFSSADLKVIDAVRNQDKFENCSGVICYGSNQISLPNQLGSKLSAFHHITLKKTIKSLVKHRGGHLVVLEDGSLVPLYPDQDKDDVPSSASPLTDQESILDVRLSEGVTSSSLSFVLQQADGQVSLLQCRLTFGDESLAPSLSVTSRLNLGKRNDIVSWDLFTGENSYLVLWKKTGEILLNRSMKDDDWLNVFHLDQSADADITAISPQFIAVIYSKSKDDGGYLQLISLDFKIVTSQTRLKTTVHKGRGLYYAQNHLFMVGGGRIAFTRVRDLDRKQDSFIGMSASSTGTAMTGALQLYRSLPDLYKAGDVDAILDLLNQALDVPEDVVVDFLDYLTLPDKAKISREKKVSVLQDVFMQNYSETILLQELSRLELDQVLMLIEIICSLLDKQDLGAQAEKKLLSWIDILLGNHYVAAVLSRDDKTCTIMEDLSSRLDNLSAKYSESSSIMAIVSTLDTYAPEKPTQDKLPYDIQILDL